MEFNMQSYPQPGTNEHNDFLTRKLAHYNEWLLRPGRTIDEGPYPGFPEEIALVQGRKQLAAEMQARKVAKETAKTDKGAPARKERKVRARKDGAGPTKQDQAVEIYKRLNGVKGDVIQMIQAELKMSLAGATTYFYNAKKLA